MDSEINLGTCCGCETTENVFTLVSLRFRSKIAGHGWGCVVCHVPSDGAMAVLCNDCDARAQREGVDKVLRFACRGYPGEDGRAPIDKFTEPFGHDMSIDHDAA
jgi:hypothetical protein